MQPMCVVHVVDEAAEEAADIVARTAEAIARLGLEQVHLGLAALRVAGRTALQAHLASLAREKCLYAVHLHGLHACLLGAGALRGSSLQARALYSPYLPLCSWWRAALTGHLLQRQLALLEHSAVIASPAEAHQLSRLLHRSVEVLPDAVGAEFFDARRNEGASSRVVAFGPALDAVAIVSRLSVLLNARHTRVPIAWLGSARGQARAQLEAAGIEVLGADADPARARALSGASVFVHICAVRHSATVVAQAMAAGVPCLASDTPAHRALVRHGETGYICTSEHDYVRKLIFLLRDRAERIRLGEAARGDARRGFTLQHFERALLRAYGLHPLPQPALSEKSFNFA